MIFNGSIVTSLDKKIKGQVLDYDYETVEIKEQEIPEQQLTLSSVGLVVL